MAKRKVVSGVLAVVVMVVPAFAQVTERVSLDSAGAEGHENSILPSISADGRYVAFASKADDLVPGDTNGAWDVFVRDRMSGTTDRVSVDSAETQGNGHSYFPSISADGRYVAFASNADNLVPGDTNGAGDVFVRDCMSGTTERVSVDSAETQGNGASGLFSVSISAAGRYVAFDSPATNLVLGDTNGAGDVFVRDRIGGTTERVSVNSAGTQGNRVSNFTSISANGRYVAFNSLAHNLVPGDTNGISDVFVRDRMNDTTERVSVDSAGTQGDGDSGHYMASISADGRCVAFASKADNLVPGDTNGTWDAFVRDRLSGTTERVSVDSAGAQGDDFSGYYSLSISADGRYTAFESFADNLVPGDTNVHVDVFVRDRHRGTTERVSVHSAGTQGNGDSGFYPGGYYPGGYYSASISADGRCVAFQSFATNLVFGDGNQYYDVFVHVLPPPSCSCLSSPPEGELDCGLPIDTSNGGCNYGPPFLYGALAMGQTVCGTAAWDGTARDTDWYSFTLAQPCTVTWTVTAEYPVVIALLDNLCPTTILAFESGGACTATSITEYFPPGTYTAFTAPDFDGPVVPCGVANSYTGTLGCAQCGPIPIALYSFDCDSNAGLDWSGGSNNGVVGAATVITSDCGNALNFLPNNNVDDFTIPHSLSVDLTGAMTGMALIRPKGPHSTDNNPACPDGTIMSKGGNYWFRVGKLNDRLEFQNEGSGTDVATLLVQLCDNAWHHVAFVREADGLTVRFYVDGSLVGTRVLVNHAVANNDPVMVGNYGFGNDPQYCEFNGDMDELRIYDQALSDADIMTVYLCGCPTSPCACEDEDFCSPGHLDVVLCPCTGAPSILGRGCGNSANSTGARLTSSGSALLDNDTLQLTATGLRSPTVTVLRQSTSHNLGTTFGHGVYCLEGVVKTLYTGSSLFGTAVFGYSPVIIGTGSANPPISQKSCALGDCIYPCSTRCYQVMYRDPGNVGTCSATVASPNFTQGRSILWQ